MQLLLDARTEKFSSEEIDDSTDLTNIAIQKSLSNDVRLNNILSAFLILILYFKKEIQGD